MFPPAHTPAGAYASILQEIIFDYSYTYDTKNFARYQWGGGKCRGKYIGLVGEGCKLSVLRKRGVNVLGWSMKTASLTSYGRGGGVNVGVNVSADRSKTTGPASRKDPEAILPNNSKLRMNGVYCLGC